LHIFQKKSVGQICVGVFLGFPFCFTGLVSVPCPTSHSPDYRGYLESLESSQSTPTTLFFFKIVLAGLLPLQSYIDFKSILSI